MTDDAPATITLRFAQGTIEIDGEPGDGFPASCRFDDRTQSWRAPASDYAAILAACVDSGILVNDEARAFAALDSGVRVARKPRPFQTEALAAWQAGERRGVVVLPTGAGKTHVALLAIDAVRQNTLVVAPTLDLVRQWYDQLRVAFDVPVGVVGGGDYDVQPLTVTTYDSAYLQMENFGARFGLLVFDECHHLPGDAYAFAARSCLAPHRLGLTATPERADGRESLLDELIGETVYRRDIVDLEGDYLAEYDVQRVAVTLSPDERAAYDEARVIYRDFVRSQGIRMSSRTGWQDFVMRSSMTRDGRAAMAAYQRQRRIAFGAPSKLEVLERLLLQHRCDRALVFTQDNATAYEIGRRFLLPVLTHQTKVTERSASLAGLAAGTYSAIVTSKVLNEGVDVPAANVAIIMSGSGSVREHVQRLGRVLRKHGDDRAVLYEVVADDTSESYTSERRRDHVAYR